MLQVWESVKGFNWRHGETHTDPFHPFEHPLAEWHHYSPSNRENYFGQVCTFCREFCRQVLQPMHAHRYTHAQLLLHKAPGISAHLLHCKEG